MRMLLVEGQQAGAVTVFVGLKIGQEVADALAERARFVESPPSRFVSREDIHLTLVPPWDETCIGQAIDERLRAALSGLKPFTLTFTRLRIADRHRPRLLCAECLPTDELKSLQQNAFGQTEDKPFQPHVTLARLQRGGRAAARKSSPSFNPSNSVELFQSRTQIGKGYQVLASLPLAAPRRKWSDLLGQGTIRIAKLWGWLAHPEGGKASRTTGRSQRDTVSKSGASKCCNS